MTKCGECGSRMASHDAMTGWHRLAKAGRLLLDKYNMPPPGTLRRCWKCTKKILKRPWDIINSKGAIK